MWRFVIIVFAGLWLSGCAVSPALLPDKPTDNVRPDSAATPPDPKHFDVLARFSLVYQTQEDWHGPRISHYSGRLHWRRKGDTDQLRIFSPFGKTLAELHLRPDLARLQQADGQITQRHGADAAEELLRVALGQALPLDALANWLFAKADDATAMIEHDKTGRVSLIKQKGWRIRYDYVTDRSRSSRMTALLPSRLYAAYGDRVDLRMRVERWGR